MRILVTSGSKRGGTEGLAQAIAEALTQQGHQVTAAPAASAPSPAGFDAVIVGAGLYANTWVSTARRYVNRHRRALRRVPVWLFSSGPLDDSADTRDIPPTEQVAVLMERVGALGHVTFGGYLAADAKGFPASALAKEHAGEFRNLSRARAWADAVAAALPGARPGRAVDHPQASLGRLLGHAVVGWAVCGAIMGALMAATSTTVALIVHAVLVPIVFVLLARHYFTRGAVDPLPTAAAWTGVVMVLDLAVVGPILGQTRQMLTSVVGTWLPFMLIFLATWATGAMMATLPWADPKAPKAPPSSQPRTAPDHAPDVS